MYYSMFYRFGIPLGVCHLPVSISKWCGETCNLTKNVQRLTMFP